MRGWGQVYKTWRQKVKNKPKPEKLIPDATGIFGNPLHDPAEFCRDGY